MIYQLVIIKYGRARACMSAWDTNNQCGKHKYLWFLYFPSFSRPKVLRLTTDKRIDHIIQNRFTQAIERMNKYIDTHAALVDVCVYEFFVSRKKCTRNLWCDENIQSMWLHLLYVDCSVCCGPPHESSVREPFLPETDTTASVQYLNTYQLRASIFQRFEIFLDWQYLTFCLFLSTHSLSLYATSSSSISQPSRTVLTLFYHFAFVLC